MTPTARLETLRRQIPALAEIIHLNSGSVGPLPQPTAEAMARAAGDELQQGRGTIAGYYAFDARKVAARGQVQKLLNAPPGSVALTHHTTDGMNIVLWGLRWGPGDEVITTSLEHEAATVPLALLRYRLGVTVRVAEVGLGQRDRTLAAIERAFTRRTRLVVLSHVVYSSGAVLPLAEILDLAHRRGVPVLVDGAQSVGAIPVDVQALDVDFYTVSGQKWLCGPEGTGALYIRPDRIDDVMPTFAGYTSQNGQDHRAFVIPAPGALRYEVATVYRPGIVGFEAGLRWLQDEVGLTWIYDRIQTLAAYCRERLSQLPQVEIITPPGPQGGLVNFDLPDWSPAALAGLADCLSERGIIVRSISHEPYCLRASTAWFNTEADIDAFCEALVEALKAGPEAVTIPDWALALPRQRQI
ncbi:MAG: aminotransferase class V-fold PLP-dependent enzyme [Anaerolineae bacterium]